MIALVDYAQHGIRLAQLLRQVDEQCLKNDLTAAHGAACEAIVESRLLAVTLAAMEQDRLAVEARRAKK